MIRNIIVLLWVALGLPLIICGAIIACVLNYILFGWETWSWISNALMGNSPTKGSEDGAEEDHS